MPSVGSEEERELLQNRVVLYTQVSLGFLVLLLLLDLVSYSLLAPAVGYPGVSTMQRRGLLVEVGACGLLAVTWWLAHRGRPSRMALYSIDGIATILLCGGLSVLVLDAPLEPLPFEMWVFLPILAFLFVHAALVPAPAIRTILLHVAAGVPLQLIAVHRAGKLEDPHPLWEIGTVWGLGVWIVLFAIVAGIISHLLHHLRLRVRQVARLGQYQLEAKLGEGGMGVVYRGRHALLRRPTAIKMLPPERAGENAVARFEREVRQTSRLTHPNTIAIYDFGRTPDGVFYYAMELVDGIDLAEAVKLGGPMPAGRVLDILRQCAGALSEAHGLGLVHRDLKPQNIVICRQSGVPDTVKVLDFGLVKDLEAPRGHGALSQAGTLLGTPHYMAPEAITDPDQVDGRADLYSLGCVAWFLLVGHELFEGRTVVEVCAKHLSDDPAPPSGEAPGAVPPDLDALILRLLQKDPAERYQSATELLEAVAACRLDAPWSTADAEAWWSRHAEAIRQREGEAEPVEKTLEVALERS